MKYLFTKINNKIKILATRLKREGLCFKENNNIFSLVAVPESYRNNETIALKFNDKKYYVSSRNLFSFFVHKQFWSSSGYINKYYKVEFDGYTFQVTETDKHFSGCYSDKAGLFLFGLKTYYIPDSGTHESASIQFNFSYDGVHDYTLSKNIQGLQVNYDDYWDVTLSIDDSAFDSNGYLYLSIFLSLRTYGGSIDYRQYLCCAKFDDASPFVILDSHYSNDYRWDLTENYNIDGMVLKEYGRTGGGSEYLRRTVVYDKGVAVGSSEPSVSYKYYGPAQNFRVDSNRKGYRQDSQGVWQGESRLFFYSPFTDYYYFVERDDYNIYCYKKQGKTLPAYPSIDGFTRELIPTVSERSASTTAFGFAVVPSDYS